MHLDLLRVCRQIYSEAALLPYALNTIDAKDLRSAERFVMSLNSAQKNAIRKLLVRDVLCPGPRWRGCTPPPPSRGPYVHYVAEYRLAGKDFLLKTVSADDEELQGHLDGKIFKNYDRTAESNLDLKPVRFHHCASKITGQISPKETYGHNW